jgi:predicted nucleotidyltransferase
MLIRKKDSEALQQIFSAAGLPLEVWAYGSRVDGSAHEGSDLDLTVRAANGKPLPNGVYMELVEKIQDSNIPILVELRDWALLPENFRRNIARQHEILFTNL